MFLASIIAATWTLTLLYVVGWIIVYGLIAVVAWSLLKRAFKFIRKAQ